jgi:hypothetical protein
VLNQSLAGLFNRWVQAGLPLSAGDLPSELAKLSSQQIGTMRALTYGASALLLASTAWFLGKPGRSVEVEPAVGNKELQIGYSQTGVEAAAIVCLMLLLSPMTSKAHYIVLLLPCMIYARALCEQRRTALWLLLPGLICAGPLNSKEIIGKQLGDLTLAWGVPTLFAVQLLVAMWLYMRVSIPHTTQRPRLAGPWRIRRLSREGACTDGAAVDERNDHVPVVVRG